MTQAKPMPEPKKCPFCGGRVETHCNGGYWSMDEVFYIECNSRQCGLIGPIRKTKRGALNAWNRTEVRKGK
jgi:hypothetical protein